MVVIAGGGGAPAVGGRLPSTWRVGRVRSIDVVDGAGVMEHASERMTGRAGQPGGILRESGA